MTSTSFAKRPFVIAVTGAQGVGKSTFCAKLLSGVKLQYPRKQAILVDGLGDRVKAAGHGVGLSATTESVAAIFTEHLRRERMVDADVVILDRCAIDALAYVRALNLNTSIEGEMYTEIAKMMSQAWRVVVSLQLSPTFLKNSAAHEDAALRSRIADSVPAIIREIGIKSAYSIDAADAGSVESVLAVLPKAGL